MDNKENQNTKQQTNNNQHKNMYRENAYIEDNQEEPKENKDSEDKNPLYWVVIIVMAAAICFLIIFLLKGCAFLKKNKNEDILKSNEWVTNMWNGCVDPVYWYIVDGTGTDGAAIDIDETLKKCDTYYLEFEKQKNFVNSLGDEHQEFKEYYQKINEQISIIYPKIKAEKPIAKSEVDYEENMQIFYEYQKKLYNLVNEKYSNK